MKIVIETNKVGVNVDIQDTNVTGAKALANYMMAVEGLLDTYKKVVAKVGATDSAINAINMHNNKELKKWADEYVSYVDDERTKRVVEMSEATLDVLKKMFGNLDLKKMKEEFEKMEDK